MVFLLTTTLSCISLLCVSSKILTTNFRLIDENHQFNDHGTITEIQVGSEEECALHCSEVGCRSFSFSTLAVCSLSNLLLHEKVEDKSVVFVKKDGFKIFSQIGNCSIHYVIIM